MDESLKPVFESVTDGMNKAIDHLNKELLKLRAGKATPSILEGVMVEYYGSPVPLNQVAKRKHTGCKNVGCSTMGKDVSA